MFLTLSGKRLKSEIIKEYSVEHNRHSFGSACCISAVRCKQCVADLVIFRDIFNKKFHMRK